MRDLVFAAVMLGLLPLAAARPFVGVLLLSWISFMNPHQTLWGFASGMPWAMLAFCVTVIGCVFAREPRQAPINAVTVFLLLFFICITITSLFAIVPPGRVWPKWELVTKMILGLLISATLLTTKHRIHAFVWLMVISVGYYGVKGGMFTLVTGGSYIVVGPPNSPIGDRNQLSVALLAIIPLMNYLRIHSRYRVVQQGMLAAMLLTLFAALGSQSRGALVGLVVTALFLWMRNPNKIVSGLAIATVVAVGMSFMPDSWWQRMNTVETFQEDSSAMSRIKIWQASLQMGLALPLTGPGFGSMYTQSVLNELVPGTRALAAHSIWLEVIGEHGFPTFLVWLGIIVAGIVYSLRIAGLARRNPELKWAGDLARMAQVSVVAYASAGSFVSLSYWDLFWAIMVVLAATHHIAASSLRQSMTAASRQASVADSGWKPQASAAARGQGLAGARQARTT